MTRHFLSLLALSFTASLSACAMAGELPDDIEAASSELQIDPYVDCEEILLRDAEDDRPPLGDEARAVAFCIEFAERENAADDTRLADPSFEYGEETRGDEDPSVPVVRAIGSGHGTTRVSPSAVGDSRKRL